MISDIIDVTDQKRARQERMTRHQAKPVPSSKRT
jgi:hypothetical protein